MSKAKWRIEVAPDQKFPVVLTLTAPGELKTVVEFSSKQAVDIAGALLTASSVADSAMTDQSRKTGRLSS